MQIYQDICDEVVINQFKLMADELASLNARNGKLLKYLMALEERIKELEGNNHGNK